MSFFFFTLPAASAMFALSLGVANIDETLPGAAYAFLSGLNASVVGVIALATTELSKKAITDDLTRMVVFFTASAGMLYQAVWYFPALLVISGLTSLVHDLGLVKRLLWCPRRKRRTVTEAISESDAGRGYSTTGLESGVIGTTRHEETQAAIPDVTTPLLPRTVPTTGTRPSLHTPVALRTGIAIITSFFVTLITVLTLRYSLPHPLHRLFSLFTNMILAGTIIFGGGPVVIPLLREYIVSEGWVSLRDFLIGLAIVQAFPGPNFNIAVFLGSLTAKNAGYNPLFGAVLAWVGIFAPGMVLVHGTMGIWSAIRGNRAVRAVLRGVNAGAVGLIYTVISRIWEVGLLDERAQQGEFFNVPAVK
ncbi:Chromate transporter domain containing protein [Naviculisporaceae sp. PSN 640]